MRKRRGEGMEKGKDERVEDVLNRELAA